MNSEATLTSLAMLKINIDIGNDYLEYLRPFILDVLANCEIELITDQAIAIKLRERFGLEIPGRTIQILLKRLAKSGLLKKSSGVFKIVANVPETNIEQEKVRAERQISSVVAGLLKYQEENAKKNMNEKIAMDALVTFLARFSIPCLRAYLRGTTIPLLEDGEDWKVILVSQYILDLQNSNPERFESFMILVQGHMLANALLCPDLQSVTQTYRDVLFFLDTPLLLQLFGLEGEPRKQAIEEIIFLIHQLDGKFAIFGHTRDELLNVIRTSADFIESPEGRGSIVTEARRRNLSKSDFLLIAEKCDEILNDNKITVESTPLYISEFQIDETTFAEVLDDEVAYYNPRAREYDINSVRSVYALRKNVSPISLERSKAVLVTSNAAFSRAAYEFGKDHTGTSEVSSVITDFSLVNTAWLKAPQGAPSLPRKEVLAFAYAAMNPPVMFWEKVLTEAEKLQRSDKISARDHQLLRSSTIAKSELMKLTLGEESALNQQTITETLRRVTDEIKYEEELKIKDEKQAHAETKKRLEEIESEQESVMKRIYWHCNRKAKIEAQCLSFSITIVLVLIALSSFISPNKYSSLRYVLLSLPIIGIISQLLGHFMEIKPLMIYKKIKSARLSMHLKNELKSFGLDKTNL